MSSFVGVVDGCVGFFGFEVLDPCITTQPGVRFWNLGPPFADVGLMWACQTVTVRFQSGFGFNPWFCVCDPGFEIEDGMPDHVCEYSKSEAQGLFDERKPLTFDLNPGCRLHQKLLLYHKVERGFLK